MKQYLSEHDQRRIEQIYEKLSDKMKVQCQRIGSNIPYISGTNGYKDLDSPDGICWWTNGFWAGMLWQMYHATKDHPYRRTAELIEERLDMALDDYRGLHHDVGFMWLHTAVANYRLTGCNTALKRGLHAANLLAGRYNPAGFIRAWNGDCTGWIIVDCMMNIPILYWASEELNDPRLSQIAQNHADTCQKITVRMDGSCNHISVLDTQTGECIENPGGQGYASGSAWSRGQAWALYGFALSYVHTRNEAYLETSKRVAHYFISNLALHDWLPLADFRAPEEPMKYDASAAMIAVCGLLEIVKHVKEYEKPLYLQTAFKILDACERKFCLWDLETDGLLSGCTGAYHDAEESTHVPVIYGDYFLVEAVLRLVGKDFLIW